MALEALLAWLHLLAILTLVVFLTSEAALCRGEWMNGAVVERLVRVDIVYAIAAGFVFITGLARVFLGVKGAGYYADHWLFWTKFTLFVAIGLISIGPTRAFLRWRRAWRERGELPDAAAVAGVRRLVMLQAHLVPLIPLAAVFLARGF